MSIEEPSEKRVEITHDEAFSVLGDETRLGILHTLAETEGPCAFSELYDASNYDDPSNFNYHLKQLEGLFVNKSDEGYVLHEAGARVVEAILAGTLTEQRSLDRTPVEQPCFRCGGDMDISYYEGHVWLHCQECGQRGKDPDSWLSQFHEADHHIVGNLGIPPAGLQNRSPEELLEAAEIYSVKETHATVRGVCPGCAAPVNLGVEVCEDHDSGRGQCETCGRENNAMLRYDCTNCIMGGTAGFAFYLLRSVELLKFMSEHNLDPIAPNAFHLTAFEETVVSTNPFKAKYRFVAGEESLTLTVDEDLSFVDVSRTRTSS